MDFFTCPTLDTFSVKVIGGSERSVAARFGDGFCAEPVPGQPHTFDVFPPDGLDAGAAFSLARRVSEDTVVTYAEPVFELDSDNTPEAGEAPGLEGADRAPSDPYWAPKLIRAHEVWESYTGHGVRIAHPDSGYVPHRELPIDRVDQQAARDFVDGDADPDGPYRHVSHGVSTGSTIVSGRGARPADLVAGVAPGAVLIPLRVAKKHGPLPAPVLLRTGARRLRHAIRHARTVGECDVISISLGWLWSRSLRRELELALKAGLIIVAAAGNYLPFVVWPAAYPEIIAVAACDYARRPWRWSSRGPEVDITGPGQDVWRAYFNGTDEAVGPSSGTSYATAMTAGLAALWLERHGGRAAVRSQADGHPIQEIFRHALVTHAGPKVDGGRGFGAGTLDAKAVVGAPFSLPPTSPLRRTGPSESSVRKAVSGLDLAPPAMDDELLFHVLTDPTLRAELDALPGPRGPLPWRITDGLLRAHADVARCRGAFLDALRARPDLSPELRAALG